MAYHPSHLNWCFWGGASSQYGPVQYELPKNVTGLQVHYLMEPEDENEDFDISRYETDSQKAPLFEQWRQLLSYFSGTTESLPEALVTFLFEHVGRDDGFSLDDFRYTKASWRILTDFYQQHCDDVSFPDFFWTYRNLFKPLFVIAQVARKVGKARLVHSVSTGYAGLLGAGISAMQNVPYIISEHGIYTKERKIDLIQADWISEEKQDIGIDLHADMGFIRRLWIRFFEQIGRTSYQQAKIITSLYEGNRVRQLRDGAPAEKTRIIPNGINLSRFGPALSARQDDVKPIVGLIGRVVPIKDIKTFIRAIKEAHYQVPDIQGWIVGPMEEDPDYVLECELLVESLDLKQQIHFLGMQNVAEILPQLKVVALTSISEAQPLVLLEAMAAGVPVLATDVGSCREIIQGHSEADRLAGEAGYLVPIASPGESARAMVSLLTDKEHWQQHQAVGLQRVRTFYDEQLMFARYQGIYEETMLWQE
ncbi:GT4 family glycosyltransferase PelF [Vibrio aerogenes]|uniref:GT4 family glycosyltransferase PelF n=1 Tax=Vibrio aerogenes TaxID=92172 RepID=UPI0021C321A7|nr:GT4 family glycosyltransferase PelF [Vibrio aerogenes]